MPASTAEPRAITKQKSPGLSLQSVGAFLGFIGFMILAIGGILFASTYQAGALGGSYEFEIAFGLPYSLIGLGRILLGCAFLIGITGIVTGRRLGPSGGGGGETRFRSSSNLTLGIGAALIPVGYYLTTMSNRPAIEIYLRARYTIEGTGLEFEGLGYLILAIGFSLSVASTRSLGRDRQTT